jgi:hypothetical protein
VRRILSFALGLGIGLVIGGNVVRRLDAVQQRFAPDRIGVAASAFVDRTRVRIVDGVGTRMRPRDGGARPDGDGAAWTR